MKGKTGLLLNICISLLFMISAAASSAAENEKTAIIKHKQKTGESHHRDYKNKNKQQAKQPQQTAEGKQAVSTPLEAGPQGVSVNPTAPNSFTQALSGDFTDSDGDGMTDVAEVKYGYDPHDASSFPTDPPSLVNATVPLPSSGIAAYFDVAPRAITIRWPNLKQGGGYYSLILRSDTVGPCMWDGSYWSYANIDYNDWQLTGTETLTGYFMEYAADNTWVQNLPTFTIDLSQLNNATVKPLQDPTNRLSYTFKDFPADKELQYRDFLKRLFPIMYYYLGPPAEQFNVVITNMGVDTGYFESTDKGRTFLSDTDFIPRLIAHEFIHAWKGGYVMSSDANWNYIDLLNGFEEGMAEGMAFEIMHEYVRSYPNDPATIQLLNWKPYQYWSSETINYDAVRFMRDTTAGDFWDPSPMVYDKYSIAATTFELLQKTNPLACKEILNRYYARINSDPTWRPTRTDLISLWAEVVPQVNGAPLGEYLDSMPVFAGKHFDEGIVLSSVIRPYGSLGDHQYAAFYANKDGKAWWGIPKDQLASYNLPSWISWMDSTPPDSYVYENTQGQPFTVNLYNANNEPVQTFNSSTEIYADGGIGVGWKMIDALAMENFPVGLYRETVTFTNYILYDSGAREDQYFFGVKGLNQSQSNEYVIMIGLDGVPSGSVAATINDTQYIQPINNGTALFRSTAWPFDLEGIIPITVTRNDGSSHTYYRTLLEAGTIHNYYQTQFIIKDKDFNGVEDEIQAVASGVSAVSNTFSSIGGSGSVKVKPQSGASWTATANDPWITITSGSAGSREGTVYYDVAPFIDTASRAGTIIVNNQTVRILQVGLNDVSTPSVAITPVSTPIRMLSGMVTQYADVTVRVGTSSIHATVVNDTWSCNLSGLPQGNSVVTVTAVAPNGKASTVTAGIIIDTTPPTVSITSPTVGETFNTSPVLTYSVSDGAIVVKVDGVIVTKASGDNLGPLSLGSHIVTVESTDVAGNVGTAGITFTVILAPLAVTTNSLADGFNGTMYNQTLKATGGTTPYVWTVASGKLPSGITLNTSTGVISGTPTATGSKTFTVQVKDASNIVVTKSLTINILAARADLIATGVTAPASGTRGSSISVSTSLKNQGTVNAGSFTVTFYLSNDSTITASDIKLGENTVKSLNKGSTTTVSSSFTIPAGTVIGNYYVRVIIDAKATITETDESNNTKASNSMTNVK